MPRDYDDPPSSPDPLTADDAPTVSAMKPPRARSIFSASPSRIVSQSTASMSPWRIRVVVEAEHEDDPHRTRTTTMKIPVKGLESSPIAAGTPRKRAKTEEDAEWSTPKKRAVATRRKTPAAKPRRAAAKSAGDTEVAPKMMEKPTPARRRIKAAGATPATRRRVAPSTTLSELVEAPDAAETTMPGDRDATPTQQSALRSVTNITGIPSPATSLHKPSQSPASTRRKEQTTRMDTFSMGEGDTLSLPDFVSSPVVPRSLENSAADRSEEEALGDITGASWTPRGSGLANEVRMGSEPPREEAREETDYGPTSHLQEVVEREAGAQGAEGDGEETMLPEDLTARSGDFEGFRGSLQESPEKQPKPLEPSTVVQKEDEEMDDDSDEVDTFFGHEIPTRRLNKGKRAVPALKQPPARLAEQSLPPTPSFLANSNKPPAARTPAPQPRRRLPRDTSAIIPIISPASSFSAAPPTPESSHTPTVSQTTTTVQASTVDESSLPLTAEHTLSSPTPLIIRPDPPSTHPWTREQYSHLDAILHSSSTPPTRKRFMLQIRKEDYPRLGGEEVVSRLGVDRDGWVRLGERECAAVVRFMDREERRGRRWGTGEVVRRMGGLVVGAIKREIEREKGLRKESAR